MMFMHADTILEVDRVSKLYSRSPLESQNRIGEIVTAAFWGRAFSVAELQKREFWALHDVSFSLKCGEAMGVIGLNGAGKTTLLRMLVGQFPPDAGEIRIAGKTAGMIDLTAGFNARMSGKENIYLRSATLGRSREEVDALYDEIADFTELDEALAAPLSTYSAGMRMRLAFATTIFVDPTLLVIDEVLAVGDFQFRQKCLERVRALRERSAFVFASHSMTDVARFCNEAIVLDKGRIDFKGEPEDAIRHFQGAQRKRGDIGVAKNAAPNKLGDQYHDSADIDSVEAIWVDADGREKASFRWGEKLILRIEFRLLRPIARLNIGVPIWRVGEEVLLSALSTEQRAFSIEPDADGRCSLEVAVETSVFAAGAYEAVLAIVDGPKYLYRRAVGNFSVEPSTTPMSWGRFVIPHTWAKRVSAQTTDGSDR
ncbi:MAG: ABC transporter ATP-binding protein [Pseudomonadota bacterium]